VYIRAHSPGNEIYKNKLPLFASKEKHVGKKRYLFLHKDFDRSKKPSQFTFSGQNFLSPWYHETPTRGRLVWKVCFRATEILGVQFWCFLYIPVCNVCIARRISPARNSQTFQSDIYLLLNFRNLGCAISKFSSQRSLCFQDRCFQGMVLFKTLSITRRSRSFP
jgi:hypothetical protein